MRDIPAGVAVRIVDHDNVKAGDDMPGADEFDYEGPRLAGRPVADDLEKDPDAELYVIKAGPGSLQERFSEALQNIEEHYHGDENE